MRFVGALLLVGSLVMFGCGGPARGPRPSARWTTGFWFWPGGSAGASTAGGTVDVLYFHVGTISKELGPNAKEPWFVSGDLPDELPPAREYWLVFRFERQDVPDLQAVPILVQRIAELQRAARQRHLNVIGVQLDIDSPTRKLPQYAGFLREVRKGLPAGLEVSITALLDWIRDGTAITEVMREVDEFVPQFYDVADPDSYGGGSAIAARIETAQWAPKFNRFGKRFRIGVSTFGRARMIPAEKESRTGGFVALWYGDLTPLDFAINPALTLQADRNEANELVLSYRANRATRIGYGKIEPGDIYQFILSTPETVRTAVERVRAMGGYCAGVVFFSWPSSRETLVMQPSEVLIAAGAAANAQRKPVGLHLVDGGCAVVHCVDVYLVNGDAFAPQAIRYKILSSTELEYFLPEEGMPVRMSGPGQLELSLPPYCGRARMYLGRAVTAKRAEFTIAGPAIEEKR
jgi:hypothetical protein